MPLFAFCLSLFHSLRKEIRRSVARRLMLMSITAVIVIIFLAGLVLFNAALIAWLSANFGLPASLAIGGALCMAEAMLLLVVRLSLGLLLR